MPALSFGAGHPCLKSNPIFSRQNLGYEFDYVRGYEYFVIDGSCFGWYSANLKKRAAEPADQSARALLPGNTDKGIW